MDRTSKSKGRESKRWDTPGKEPIGVPCRQGDERGRKHRRSRFTAKQMVSVCPPCGEVVRSDGPSGKYIEIHADSDSCQRQPVLLSSKVGGLGSSSTWLPFLF